MRIALIFPVLVVAAITSLDVETEGGSLVQLVIFAFVAIGFSFLCSIAEAVLLSVTPSYIAVLREQRVGVARLLERLKANIDRPLSAILSLNTIAHTVGAAGVGAQAAGIWGNRAVGLASAVMTLLILVLSEIIPKTIGAIYWRELAAWTAYAVRALIVLLYPFVWLSDQITRLFAGHRHQVVTADEVAAMATLSAEGGQMELKESNILKNVFRLRSLTVHDIMTPRPVIFAFPEDKHVGQLLSDKDTVPVSRIPIYRDTIDRVTGFVLKTDILLEQARGNVDTPLRDLKRPIEAVPATATLSQLFDLILEQREHLALVIDEYGGTDGLVTLEDLVETLLGVEIVDEADTDTDMQRLARRKWEQRAKALGLDTSAPAWKPPGDAEPE